MHLKILCVVTCYLYWIWHIITIKHMRSIIGTLSKVWPDINKPSASCRNHAKRFSSIVTLLRGSLPVVMVRRKWENSTEIFGVSCWRFFFYSHMCWELQYSEKGSKVWDTYVKQSLKIKQLYVVATLHFKGRIFRFMLLFWVSARKRLQASLFLTFLILCIKAAPLFPLCPNAPF